MTSYIRKPSTYEELLIEATTTSEDLIAFFGTSYDTNRLAMQGAGFVGSGSFAVILGVHGEPGPVIVNGNTGGYYRAERRGDGKTVGISYSTDALADD